jgi:hypothetical protein
MKIHEDPEFVKDIYKDCPRLQHLMDQYPDLRHVFSDPKMIRINFEQVYREAGGILPEDEEEIEGFMVWFANSSFMKSLKRHSLSKRPWPLCPEVDLPLRPGF